MSNSGNSEVLPRSLYAPQRDPRANVREMVNSVFNDKFMIFLSIAILPTILIPYLFNATPLQLSFLDIIDWVIVVLFVVEYVAKLYLSENRWQHFKSPWHLVDLAIIIIPFIQFAPVVNIGIRGHPSLLFRLFTLPRVLAVGSRAAIGRRPKDRLAAGSLEKQPNTLIMQVDADLKTTRNLTWDELQVHLLDNFTQEWIDIRNISDEGFARLSDMLKISEPHFKSALVDEIYPHIDYVERVSFIFLQSGKIKYPENTASYLTIARSGIIVICSQNKILTISKHSVDLFRKVLGALPKTWSDGNFVVTMLYGILENILNDYKSLLSEIEMEVIRIGSLPKAKLPKDFLERVYQFGKEVGRLVSNLVHFKETLNMINRKNVPLEGLDHKAEEALHVLQETALYLNEIADDLIGNLRSIIDLYINQTAFETNRILKVLAVITAIAVIPSALGGILGMNLLDVPFHAYLWQLVMVIAIIMLFMSYVFTKLGWLKT